MTECVAAHGCITCGDVAVAMTVLNVDRERSLALCSGPDGERSSVEVALVEPVSTGELLLVHAGTALGRAAEVPAAEEPAATGEPPTPADEEGARPHRQMASA